MTLHLCGLIRRNIFYEIRYKNLSPQKKSTQLQSINKLMKKQKMTAICVLLVATVIGTPNVWAKKKNPKTPEVQLTQAGQQLESQYSKQLESLKAEISKALPTVDGRKKSDFLKSREVEVAAEAAVSAAQNLMSGIHKAEASVKHATGKWIGGADKGIKASTAKLKMAKTDAERQAAQKELVTWQKNREAGVSALKERQAILDEAKRDESKTKKALKDAQEALAQAKAATSKAIKNLGLNSLLSSDKLDAKLAQYVVLMEATPRGLAAFSQKGDEQRKLIDKMLSTDDLLVQMAVADGAKGGKYGQAMQIYQNISKASEKVAEGPLHRLALAISLEHAVPVKQRNAVANTEAAATVDPVKRYLHFEKAFLAGDLDPAFKDLSTWDYRMVIDGEEPDEILTWGREMLRNYRPDQITKPDYRWRYVEAVRSDIRYGSQDNKYDKPELQFFQNILMNGGVCGRRAFYGRFILRSFGIPVTARPQRGHAALAHWTPKGWVVCLGAGWGSGWTKTQYNKDLDFLATTQARAVGKPFMQVKRAQWIGDSIGESRVFGFQSKTKPGLWYGASLYTQKGMIEAAKTKTLAAVGEDIGEANETKEKVVIAKVTMSDKDRKVSVDSQGVITIPAVATSKPTKSTAKLIFMNSHLGGKQLHYSRTGGNQTFEYTFDAPAAGEYVLTARVVSPSWKQQLQLAVNGSEKQTDIALPHTVGMWDKTQPANVTLVKGKNVLAFSRDHEGLKGVSIKDFTLTPLN